MDLLGHHVGKEGVKTFDEALAAANDATVQVFVVGPRNSRALSAADLDAIKADATKRHVYVHASYLSNLWGRKPEFGRMICRNELAICDDIGAAGYVLHLARAPVAAIASELKILSDQPFATRIFLEIESYRAEANTYETAEKLRVLFAELAAANLDLDKFGVCVDTAHLWAAGETLDSAESAAAWFDKLSGVAQIKHYLIHLNDQTHAKGAGRDEHAPLAYGTIWGKYNTAATDKSAIDIDKLKTSGLYSVLQWAVANSVDMILERRSNKPKINNLPIGNNILSDRSIVQALLCEKND